MNTIVLESSLVGEAAMWNTKVLLLDRVEAGWTSLPTTASLLLLEEVEVGVGVGVEVEVEVEASQK